METLKIVDNLDLYRIHNDLLGAEDSCHTVCLSLLQLAPAFNIVDHIMCFTFLEE